MSSSVARPATVAAGARAVTSGTPAIATEISLGLTTPSVVNGIPTDASALIDDVAVRLAAVPVPEPATWALLLCGLGAVAAFGRGAHRRASMSA